MLKRAIKYVDFNGDDAEDIVYFNLSESELVELEVGKSGGMSAFIQRVVEQKDSELIIRQFKEIILAAYGIKSDDGKTFEKSEELSKRFSQTAAYQALFLELVTQDEALADFIKGVMPKGFVLEMAKTDTPAAE